MLGLIGLVWLAVEPVNGPLAARSSPPADAASSERHGDAAPALATTERGSQVIKPVASQPIDVVSVVVSAEPTSAVRAVGARENLVAIAAEVDGPVAVGVSPSALDVRPSFDSKRSVTVAAVESVRAVDTPAEDGAPARDVEDGQSPASIVAPTVALPRPRPAAPFRSKVASLVHHRSAHERFRARSRAARHARSRHSTRYGRREPAAQERPVPERTVMEETRPVPEAARMLDSLAKQWAAAPRSLRAPGSAR
jgi:hypothetical protein